jgi:NAD+ synthase (glutamine-hydrolysing)
VEQSQSAEEIVAQGFDEGTVRRVLRLVRNAEFKRKQAAPVLKVTSWAFGTGGGMPPALNRIAPASHRFRRYRRDK